MNVLFPNKPDIEDVLLFKTIFNSDLLKYWNFLFGFDLIKFDTDFYPENIVTDGKSLADFIREEHGEDASRFIERLIKS